MRSKRWRAAALAVSLLAGLGVVGSELATGNLGTASAAKPGSGGIADGSAVVYAAATVIPPPPPATFATAASGDGFDLAFGNGTIYNVFHHNADTLWIDCHSQVTGATCAGFPKGIPGYSTSLGSGGVIDAATNHFFVFADRISDNTAGVVESDLSNAGAFVGFTPLTPAGEASLAPGFSTLSNVVQSGTRIFAFNYVTSYTTPSGARDRLLCFDLSNRQACSNQPYATGVELQTTVNDPAEWRSTISQIGGRIFTAAAGMLSATSADRLYCFDPSDNTACSGWPVVVDAGSASHGLPIAKTNGSGVVDGVCFSWGTFPCFSMAGATVTTPAGLAAALPVPVRGAPFVTSSRLSDRVYMPLPWSNQAACYDYSTASACAGFPVSLNGLNLPYTVNVNPSYPTCLWVNSNDGSSQIQTFDAYTGGKCADAGVRVQLQQIVAPYDACNPTSWSSLQLLSPRPSTYRNGTLQFQNANGGNIGSSLTFDSQGKVNLLSLGLPTSGALPQMQINLPGAEESSLIMSVSWTGTYHAQCTTTGQTATIARRMSQPTIDYTGTSYATPGSQVTLSSTLTGGCTGSSTIQYAVTPNPFTAAPGKGSYIFTGTPNTTLDTTGWLSPKVYEVAAIYVGDADCYPAVDDLGVLTLDSEPTPVPGGMAMGGGWYQYSGRSPKVNFGFAVHPTATPGLYNGQLVWNMKGAWRFKGELTLYTKLTTGGTTVGTATGAGRLLTCNATSSNGCGQWTVVSDSVPVTLTFEATDQGAKKNTPGALGISLAYTPTGSQQPLPPADRQKLGGGIIKMS